MNRLLKEQERKEKEAIWKDYKQHQDQLREKVCS